MRPAGSRPRPGRDGRQPDAPVSLQKSRTRVTTRRLPPLPGRVFLRAIEAQVTHEAPVQGWGADPGLERLYRVREQAPGPPTACGGRGRRLRVATLRV